MQKAAPSKSRQIEAIQALRALAVSWVVIDHAFPHALPGGFVGVDIFFVISGFLITTHLYEQIREETFSFGQFYLRRARRLLPAALTVLVTTSIASIVLLPPAWLSDTLMGTGAAALYFVNWWLAISAVDYFADSGIVSPVNHYWSLSVEEQFYILWPALLWLTWRWAARPARRGDGRVFGLATAVAISLVILISLPLAMWAVEKNSLTAYFFTHTRAWELAAGGLAGILLRLNLVRIPPRLRPVLFLVGWAVLISSGWLVGPASGVPGLVTVPIVLATAMLLFLGDDHGVGAVARVISARPVQWLGDVSYSFYLWHWPFLILTPFALNVESLSMAQTFVVVLVSLGLSGLTKTHVEDRFRIRSMPVFGHRTWDAPWGRVVLFVAMSILVGGGARIAAQRAEDRAVEAAQELYELSVRPDACFGARAREDGADCPQSHQLARKFFALQSWGTQVAPLPNRIGHGCQVKLGVAEPSVCSFGAPPDKAEREIALVGDSHAGMWMAALAQFAEAENIRVTTFLASACPATDATDSFATYLPFDMREGCLKWREAASAAILANPAIDMVVTTSNAINHRTWKDANWVDDDGSGFADLWTRFVEAGKKVVVIDDVPILRTALPECLARPHPDVDPCSRPASEVPESNAMSRGVARMQPGQVTLVPMRDVFCDDDRCHAIIGGIPAYMDENHISAPMARSLAERIRDAVVAAD